MIRPEEGGQLGRYRILRRLGAGAMGEVYLAEDPQIGRRLAIKTVRLEEGRPQEVEERKKRLLREARAAGKLLHPNVVTLFDAGEDRGALFLAFEWVDGTDVDRRVAEGPPLNLAEALAIVRQTAEGLDYAHRQGVVHRDIKPSNVMLTADGRVKVADFGIAKVVDSTSDLTMSGSVVGSPHYLSPEQIRGEELDGRTDIFSLGVLLYEILCHRRPFDGDTLTTLVYQILNQEPTPVDVRRPDLGPRLERLVRRMLHKDREQRFATAGEVAAEIAACEREMAPELLAARAVPDEPTEATILLPEEGSPGTTGSTELRETARRAVAPAAAGSGARSSELRATAAHAATPPPPPPPAVAAVPPPPAAPAAPARSGSGRILLFAVGATVVAGALLALGWGARRWTSGGEAKAETPARPPVAASDPAPENAADAPRAGEARSEPAPEAPASAASEPPPYAAGDRAVVRPATVAPPAVPPRESPPATAAPAIAAPVPAAPAPEPRPPAQTAPEAANPAPAPSPEPAVPPPPTDAEPDRRAARDELVARLPVQREMATGMSLSFELPKPIAERAIVRFDRIVIGRAAEWNASKRGGRAYAVPEPGLHIVTFLLDGAEIYRIRIDAQPGRPAPTVVAPEGGGDERRPRRRGAD